MKNMPREASSATRVGFMRVLVDNGRRPGFLRGRPSASVIRRTGRKDPCPSGPRPFRRDDRADLLEEDRSRMSGPRPFPSGSSPRECRGCARSVGTIAPTYSVIAENVGAAPRSVGTIAEEVGDRARSVGTIAENVGAAPRSVGTIAENVGAAPRSVGTIAEEIGGRVLSVGGRVPSVGGRVPSGRGRGPDRRGPRPVRRGRGPDRSGPVPTLGAASPDQVGPPRPFTVGKTPPRAVRLPCAAPARRGSLRSLPRGSPLRRRRGAELPSARRPTPPARRAGPPRR